jgi:hypothetical protein
LFVETTILLQKSTSAAPPAPFASLALGVAL